MKIQLNLENHCIETEIKRRHEAAMAHYFKDEEGRGAAEMELVLLEKAIESFDFAHLRNQWPVLTGGSTCPVFLTCDDFGPPCLQFENRRIIPPGNEK
jgi:hypothetical protein